MPMTNAERQRGYRDRRRGGPPKGRWAGHVSIATTAKVHDTSRTLLVMGVWILRYAPDEAPALDAGTAKTTPTYRRLRNEYIMAVAKALSKTDDPNARVVVTRKSGRFVARLVK